MTTIHFLVSEPVPATWVSRTVRAIGYAVLAVVLGYCYVRGYDSTVLAGVDPAVLRYFLIGMLVIMTVFVATGAAAIVAIVWDRARWQD